MNTLSYTFRFPITCDQSTMLRMVVLLLNVRGFDTKVFPGNLQVPEEEFTRFSQAHPDFLATYMELSQFAALATVDYHATLENIMVVPASGCGIITYSTTPKTPFTEIGGL